MRHVYNFYAGPSKLPKSVLKRVQDEFLNYEDAGMSIVEMSHRSAPVEAMNDDTEARLRRLMGIPENYRVLFLQGGATTQFAMIPMNLLKPGFIANYILSGHFAAKAYEEACLVGATHVAASTEALNYRRLPSESEIQLSDAPAYVHLTSNNTIYGTQWASFPSFGDVPVVVDMSSDILSRPVDVSKFALIYAGAQKNLGPAGVTIVIVRDDLLQETPKTPTIFRYQTFAKTNSMYNTPPVFSIYVMGLVLEWLEQQGGPDAMKQLNERKAGLLYDAIDGSGGFYRGHAEKESRSNMNITFRLPTPELEKQCIKEAAEHGIIGVGGHRSVGGMRMSNYNAMDLEGCTVARDFLVDFARRNG